MNPVLKELEAIITRLPLEKLELLLNYAQHLEEDELTPQDKAEIEAGKDEIARGEWVDWDELRKELNL